MDFFPSEGAAIGGRADVFRTAHRIVSNAHLGTMIERWANDDRAGRRTGPSPWLSEVQVITLMLVLTLSRRPALFTEMRDLLRNSPEDCIAVLGIEMPEAISDSALYHRAYNSYRRLVRLMDPEPGSLYRTLSRDELRQRMAARDPQLSAARRDRAHEFTNALLWGTWLLLPRKVRRSFKGDVAVDATVIKAPARGRSNRSPWASSDPEAGWYKRDGDHDGDRGTSRAATKYQRRHDSLLWARELHTAVTYGNGVPVVTLAATLDVPGKRLPQNALTCIDSLQRRDVPAGNFVSDRAYLPGSKAEDLALPLRARGYTLVFDYDRDKTSLGKQASNAGAIMVEGHWYCPSMPEPLQNASIDFSMRDASDPLRIGSATYRERIAQRKHYALHTKQRPDSDGYQRLQCPAVGGSATVRCPRKDAHPRAVDRPLTRILPLMLVTPEPQVCSQQTITVPPASGAKFEQGYAYRSDQWNEQYTPGRQSVESMNKSMKDGRFAPIDDPEVRPRRGWLAQLLSLAVMVAATNTRKIIAWLHEQVGLTSLSSAPVRRERRREITKGWTTEPNAPPAAAAIQA